MRLCYYCHGDGIKRRGGACHICGGSGYHPDWDEMNCADCGAVMEYCIHWDNIPDLCEKCRQDRKSKWRNTTCKDCGATVYYHVDWDRIPDLCKDCREERRAKWHTKNCTHCGGEFSYHEDWERISDYCKKCNTYLEKPCAHCSRTVKYRIWWGNIPNHCRKCNRYSEKPCEVCDTGTVKYKVWWDNPPIMCRDCWENKSERVLHLKEGDSRAEFSRDEELPYIGRSLDEVGHFDEASATFYTNPNTGRESIHVTLRRSPSEDSGGNEIKRFSYDLEPETGELIEGSAHATTVNGKHPQIPISSIMSLG